MALLKVVPVIGQSEVDGRLTELFPWIIGGLIPGVKAFNRTALVDFDILDDGPSGNGSSWATEGGGGSSNNKFGWDSVLLKQLAELIGSTVNHKVTNGGSRLSPTGPNDVNGSWYYVYGDITVGTPRLMEDFATKWGEFKAFCTANGHTYEVPFIIMDQMHGDDPTPTNYPTYLPIWLEFIRTTIEVPNCPIIASTYPWKQSQFNKTVRNAWYYQATQDENLYLFSATYGDVVSDSYGVDTSHKGPIVTQALADWGIEVYNEIIDPPIPTTQPANRSVFTTAIQTMRAFDSLDIFLTLTGIVDSGIEEDLQTLLNDLTSADLKDQVIIWPLVGGTVLTHAYNLNNANVNKIAFGGGVTHSSNGVQMNGTNSNISMVGSGVRITDIPWIKTNDFGCYIYSRTNQVNANVVDFSVNASGITGATMRYFPSSSLSTAKMRFDINSANSNFVSDSAMTDTLRNIGINIRGGNMDMWQEGVKKGTKVFNIDFKFNGYLEWGYDATAASRYSAKEYSALVITKGLIDSKVQSLHQIITTFQTNRGRNV